MVAGILLSSCGGQNNASPTQDLGAILTAAVGTVVESVIQTQTALAPSATVSPTMTPSPTETPFIPTLEARLPTATPIYLPILVSPTGTQYTPTVNPSTLASGCNNLLLIRDETIPDGTVFKPGDNFTKTWKVANTGTCDWVYLYRLVFSGGDRMGGAPQRLAKVIAPGKWTQISVDLRAPTESGKYTGYWRFGDQSGNGFGSTLTVSIVVASPTSYP